MSADAKALHVYEVDDGEQHWIVAADEAGVREAMEAYEIGTWYDEPVTITRIPDDRMLTIGDMDGENAAPEGATSSTTERGILRHEATAKAWAEWAGAGSLIGSTVY